MNRREFLATASATALIPAAANAAATTRLIAAPVALRILPDGDELTKLLGFNGKSPGPEIRARQGERIEVAFENGLVQGSAIHWHGIHLENAMDGVPGLTQSVVEPGEAFEYSFEVPHPGTFWYHSHHRSWEQVAKGLYGPLIVEEIDPPLIDRDITVFVDDWRISRSGELQGDFGNLHDFSHAGRLGTFARALFSQDKVMLGDRLRLRLINASVARIFSLEIGGGSGVVAAHDGMPLPDVVPLGKEALQLAPAQRTDVILDVSGPVDFMLLTQQGPYELGTIVAEGTNPTPIEAPIGPLPSANLPIAVAEGSKSSTLVMQGGAMGGRHGGSDIWAFNDYSGLPEKPWRKFAIGEVARIELRNDTAFPHGIHLHGHHFHEIANDGSLGHYRDTTLVMHGQSQEILCMFDNPGKWLLHCHTLGHQASGMKTWIEVS
ncbi:MAG: multicopper oxidase family protein [Albidovulum sp.]|nr:multicopper oxidase family protein [Albidovulum sp.]MDE0529990.1 multicopper oxidase family protein [Albidovulum sp.]